MKLYDKTVVVHVNDFRFSVGGEHYYGRLRLMSCGDEGVELKRPISSKEAKYFNKKDSAYSAKYKAGDLTDRFDKPEDVVEAAKAKWREVYPDALLLVKGNPPFATPRKWWTRPPRNY